MKKTKGGGKKPNTKTKAKAPARKRKPDAAEAKAASAANGDALPPGPSPEQIDQGMADLLDKHVGILLPLLESQKNATARVNKAKEAAKKAGLKPLHLKIALQLETDDGEKKKSEEIEETLMVARWRRTKLGTQMSFGFAQQQQAPSDAERHYADGRRAATQDRPRKPPDVLAHDDAQHWMRGWDERRVELNVERSQGFFKSVGEAAAGVIPGATETDGEHPAAPPIGTEAPTHQVVN